MAAQKTNLEATEARKRQLAFMHTQACIWMGLSTYINIDSLRWDSLGPQYPATAAVYSTQLEAV